MEDGKVGNLGEIHGERTEVRVDPVMPRPLVMNIHINAREFIIHFAAEFSLVVLNFQSK